jgi:hypothetical protein
VEVTWIMSCAYSLKATAIHTRVFCVHSWLVRLYGSLFNVNIYIGSTNIPVVNSEVYAVVALLLSQLTATLVIYWVNTRAGPLFCSHQPSPKHWLAVAISRLGGGLVLLKCSLCSLRQTQSGLIYSISCYYPGQSTFRDCELCVLGLKKTNQEGFLFLLFRI